MGRGDVNRHHYEIHRLINEDAFDVFIADENPVLLFRDQGRQSEESQGGGEGVLDLPELLG